MQYQYHNSNHGSTQDFNKKRRLPVDLGGPVNRRTETTNKQERWILKPSFVHQYSYIYIKNISVYCTLIDVNISLFLFYLLVNTNKFKI